MSALLKIRFPLDEKDETSRKLIEWQPRLEKIEYAFQPIVNIHTGNAFGFEALLRCHEEAGFSSIDDLFNQAWKDHILHQIDLELRKKALQSFAQFKQSRRIKLFYNLDNRLLCSRDYASGLTSITLKKLGYSLDDICFEISEKHDICQTTNAVQTISNYRAQGFKIAVDDCGTGFSGFQTLYYAEPDYIKIDRFFIQNMENDPKKRLLVSTIVNMAHFMGSLVMAEGVETEDELVSCRNIGCDMLQGYFVAHPTSNIKQLQFQYRHIDAVSRRDKRQDTFKDRNLIKSKIEYIPPISSSIDTISVFDRFRQDEEHTFFPVVTQHKEPIGIIRETAFKQFIFHKYGRQLLENPTFGKDLNRFLTRIPIVDLHASVEKMLEIYAQFNSNEGILIIDDNKYVGFISPQSLLKIINEKNLTFARNQNPLSKLPGNTMIHEYFSKALADIQNPYLLVYFDFDYFKPFNDTYGFRNGDRLILMFSELLKEASVSKNRFAGHVGGDDFFLGIRGDRTLHVINEMKAMATTFKRNAESFYDAEAMKNGFIVAKDRDGIQQKIPLTSVSIAIMELPAHTRRICSIEDAASIIAILKKRAKTAPKGICTENIMTYLTLHKKSIRASDTTSANNA